LVREPIVSPLPSGNEERFRQCALDFFDRCYRGEEPAVTEASICGQPQFGGHPIPAEKACGDFFDQ
jgi:hypothetical protein